MADPLAGDRGVRVSAALILGGAVLSGPVAMLLVSQVAPQPPWRNVGTFADSYHPIQVLPYALGYLLLGGFVLFSAACHALAPARLRMRTSAALVFSGVYAALVFTNYTLQLGYIPRVLHGRPGYVAELTMANPASFAWFLEMFGYAAEGVATWLLAAAFGGGRRADLVHYLLIGNGVTSVVGAVCTAAYDRWVFTTSGMICFGAWNLLIAVCYLLIAMTPGGGLAPAAARE